VRRVVDRIPQERVNGRARFEPAVIAVKISTEVPLSAVAKGYFTERSFDANSSFDRAAIYRRPSLNAMSVIDCWRGSR
jgi:hypothetical protein